LCPFIFDENYVKVKAVQMHSTKMSKTVFFWQIKLCILMMSLTSVVSESVQVVCRMKYPPVPQFQAMRQSRAYTPLRVLVGSR